MNHVSIFSRYDITSELMLFVVNIILLLLMSATQPKKTRMYKIELVGAHNTMLTIVFHILLLYSTCVTNNFNIVKFRILYVLYITSYITVLNEIFAYINLLSYTRRANIAELCIKIGFLSVIYYAIALYPLITGKILLNYSNRVITLTNWQYAPEICGIICATVCMITCLTNHKSLSKIVFWGILVFTPLHILILIMQFHFRTVYFISFTYVVPFLIFYILFHSSTFDDIIGCQNMDGIDTRIKKSIKRKKNFVIIYITFPQLRKREFSDITSIVQEGSSQKCRQIEGLFSNGHIYKKDSFTYTMFAPVKNTEEAEVLAEKIRLILSEPFEYFGKKYKVFYKQVVINSSSMLSYVDQYISMIGYLSKNFNNQLENEYVIAKNKDYHDFNHYYTVEKAILDIRTKGNLNDSRVISYIQPIHCIQTNTFRTGEALLRLRIDDELIRPDIVIEVAESNNCIHELTLIMLNKICQQIKILEANNYDFDAITVNCSTEELADPEFHNEIMHIILSNQIMPSHIRLEITESTSVTNYENILYNMNQLKERGISFYLDDFGTGYSNLERITSFPFNTIKFDKSILYSALEKKSSDKLIKMLVSFFKNNQYNTVIEGVETEQQYEYCKKIGFDYVQGFLYSKPVPSEQITLFFRVKE